MRRSRSSGFTLMETTAALAIVGLAILAAATLLGRTAVVEQRLAARREALRALENTLEAVRAGAIPLASGSVANPPHPPLQAARKLEVRLEVVPEKSAGLSDVTAVARFEVRGRKLEERLPTRIWRGR